MMNTKHRPTIGENPLDSILPVKAATKVSRKGPSVAGTAAAERKSVKVRATFHLPMDLFEECRDVVVHLSGPPVRLTLSQFAENGLRREVERLKRGRNRGKDFPKRESELRGGRPIGS